ncbi:hypothetical protein PHYC_03836 [Phycisphaerales bacterium]|nr:hypothetical protein PHYC_03836 [Phycisphaerales bacterium]
MRRCLSLASFAGFSLLSCAAPVFGQPIASGLPEPDRKGTCDNVPESPGQRAPGDNHDNGDHDYRDVCMCIAYDCGSGFGPGGGPSPADLWPDGIVESDPPESPPGIPADTRCSFADADSEPHCGAVTEQNVRNFTEATPGYQGWGWFQHSRPELVVDDDDTPTLVRIYVGARKVLDFRLVPESNPHVFVGVNGVNGVVKREDGASGSPASPELYRYYDAHGNIWTFFGHHTGSSGNWLDAEGASGQLWTASNADGTGDALYTGHATSAYDALEGGFEQDGSGNYTARATTVYDGAGRRWTYEYSTVGGNEMLTSITIAVNSGSWTTVWSSEYSYYTTTETDEGLAGDLKMVTETRPLSSGGNEVRKTYLRYYTSSSPDLRHLLKFKVDPEGVRRIEQATLDPAAMSDADLKAYSSLYYEYNSVGRVTELLTSAGCGCGGSVAGTYEFTQTFNSYSGGYADDGSSAPGDWGYSRWASRTEVSNPDGTKTAFYFDEMGWMLAKVHTDAATSGSPWDTSQNSVWITKIARDGIGRPTHVYSPASISGYNHSTGAITVSTSAGLVTEMEYYGSYLPYALKVRKVRQGSGTTALTLEEYDYLNPSTQANGRTFGTTNTARLAKPLVTSHKVYRDTSVADETTFTYSFYSGSSSWAPQKRIATLPALESGDTSGPSSVTQHTYFDERGRVVFSKDGSGVFSFTAYGTDGLVSKRIADPTTSDSDANSVASAVGATLPSSGLRYATTYAYDNLGRLTSTTLPSGRVSVNHHTKLNDGRVVSLNAPSLSGSTYTGPADYTVRNLAGKVEAQGVIALSSTGSTTTAMSGWITTSSSDVIGAVATGSVAHLTGNVYDNHGTRLDETRLYHSIPSTYPGTAGTHYDTTTYGYDDIGRPRRVKDSTGTITYDKRDALGRVFERYIGTDDAGWAGGSGTSNNMAKVETIVFDGGAVGNGLVTSRKGHVDSSSGNDRITTYTYDYRGQLMVQANPQSPHFVFKRDRAGHVIAAGGYTTSPGVVDPTSSASNRVSLSESVYNSRGQARQTIQHKIDPSDGSSGDSLTRTNWFDDNGRVLKSRGDSLVKTAYDAFGRPTNSYVLAADNDSSYTDVKSVIGDTVMEERQSLYDNSDKTGNLLMSVAIERHPHDTSTTGALDAVADAIDVVATGSSSFKGRGQITSFYYDPTLEFRQTATVALGNNGGSTYTRSSDSSVGTRSASRLISSAAYNPDGSVLSNTDPKGIVTQYTYDAANRRTASIANYVNGTPSGGDDDQVVEYVYTNGLMTQLKAKVSSSAYQTTTYTYGTLQTGTLASTITSNRLLRQVQYPDSAGGSDVVKYGYNRQGQQTGVLDQAGNQIDTAYDTAGRELSRTVSTLATGFDGGVRRIEMAYLTRGPVSTVTQYDAATSGNVTDQVKFEYDNWGQISHFRQDVDSTMDSNGASNSGRAAFDVAYTVAKSAPSGGVHTLRRTAMAYKNGGTTFTDVGFTYGSATINDYLSRVATVTVGSTPTTVASYDYLGADHLVGTTLDQAQLNTSVFTESGGAHTYSDIDQFNRPTRWNWERIGGASGGFYNVSIKYDENSNPTSTVDDVHIRASSSKHIFDVVYTLDALNRVTGADEGNASGTPLAITTGDHTRNELWNSLSLTGNWKNRQLDINGNGSFTDEEDRNEPSADQTFNDANEWTDRKITKTGSDNDTYDYTYDAVGNLTYEDLTKVRGQTNIISERGFVYDAFGRMVRVTGLPVDEVPATVQNHRYNGLNFHIMEQSDTDLDGTLENSERRYFMFDERWRIVGSFLDLDGSGAREAFVNHAAGSGGFGGASYIDSVILRDRDTDGNGGLDERRYLCQNWRADVVAVTKSDGTPLEYVRYSSYGEPIVYSVADLNMDGVVNSADANEWDNLYSEQPDTSAYATADIDFDGSPSTSDGDLFNESYTANSGLSGKGRVSTPEVGNRIGYAGYRWDGVSRAYECRHRRYFAEIGRWGRRDGMAYSDGCNLLQYVRGMPIEYVDPSGLLVAVYRCERKPDLPWPISEAGEHWWVWSPGLFECGLGPEGGGVPGEETSIDCPYTKTCINDHSGQHVMANTTCHYVSGCNVSCLQQKLRVGRCMGPWVPGVNDCNTVVHDAMQSCGCKNECLEWGRGYVPIVPDSPYTPGGVYVWGRVCKKWLF